MTCSWVNTYLNIFFWVNDYIISTLTSEGIRHLKLGQIITEIQKKPHMSPMKQLHAVGYIHLALCWWDRPLLPRAALPHLQNLWNRPHEGRSILSTQDIMKALNRSKDIMYTYQGKDFPTCMIWYINIASSFYQDFDHLQVSSDACPVKLSLAYTVSLVKIFRSNFKKCLWSCWERTIFKLTCSK